MEKSSGNVFEDLGLDNPQERLLKSELAFLIQSRIEARGLNQSQAAKLLKTHQPAVSSIIRGDLKGYSLERLIGYASILDPSLRIRIECENESGRGGKSAAKAKRAIA